MTGAGKEKSSAGRAQSGAIKVRSKTIVIPVNCYGFEIKMMLDRQKFPASDEWDKELFQVKEVR